METVQPFLMKFRSSVPTIEVQLGLSDETRFDLDREIWLDESSLPLYANRAAKPYTNVMTAGRQIKGGFTPSGKYRTPKYIPTKMDKRAGK